MTVQKNMPFDRGLNTPSHVILSVAGLLSVKSLFGWTLVYSKLTSVKSTSSASTCSATKSWSLLTVIFKEIGWKMTQMHLQR